MRYAIAAALFASALLQSAAAAQLPGRTNAHHRPGALVDNDTYHYDTLRSGWNAAETSLTTANVATAQFGKLFSVPMDGLTFDQPLIAAGESIPGNGTHDLLIAGTNRDRLYAYDANTGAPIWEVNFTGHGAGYVPIKYTYCNNTGNSDGILSTPVIDRGADVIYVVVATLEGKAHQKSMHYRLHRLQLATGQETFGSPKEITATYTWSGSPIVFNPNVQFQRASLLEWTPPNGSGDAQIVIGFGSQCDFNGNVYHGWLMAYDATTLAQAAVQNVTPAQDSYGNYYGGIWMSGNGPAEDANGFVYTSVGNGTFDGSTSFGESILKLPGPSLSTAASSGFQFFTPYTVYQDNAYDADTGSGGIMLLPDQSGPYAHEIVMQGKDGIFTLLNRDAMGGFTPSGPDKALAELGLGSTWSSPAYYQDGYGNSYVYTTGYWLYQVQISNGNANVVGNTNVTFPSTNGNGSTPTISSNGGTPGTAIAWIVQRPGYPSNTPMYLYAFDASNLQHTLFRYKLGRWPFPSANPTLVPTVANGKVYVATASTIDVFGLH